MDLLAQKLLQLKSDPKLGEMVTKAEANVAEELKKEAALKKKATEKVAHTLVVNKHEQRVRAAIKHCHFPDRTPFQKGNTVLVKEHPAKIIGVVKKDEEAAVQYAVCFEREMPITAEAPQYKSKLALVGSEEIVKCNCRGYLPNHKACSPRKRFRKAVKKASSEQ